MCVLLQPIHTGIQKLSPDMNTLTFNNTQAAAMSAIACNEAKADYAALAQAINEGLDA